MSAFANKDGVPLNVSQAVQDDRDASNLARTLTGQKTAEQRRDADERDRRERERDQEVRKGIWDEFKSANESNKVSDLDNALDMMIEYFGDDSLTDDRKITGKYSFQIKNLKKRTMDKLEDMRVSAPGGATEWESKYSNWRRESDSDDESGGVSAAAMSAPPSIDMTQWNGPTMSRKHNKPYYTRKSDGLAVWGDRNTGELTQARIDEAETHKAKKAAKKGGVKVKKTKKTKKKKKTIKTQAQKDKENKRRRFLRSLKKDSFRADAGQITRPEWSNPNELKQAIQETYMDEAKRARLAERVGLERVKSDDEDDKFPNLSFIQKEDLTQGDVAREAVGDRMKGGRKTRKMKGGHHLYKRLGVSKYASQKQIKKAYNKLKKKKKLTKKVKYAYKILSKKKSRKKYNAKYKKHKKSKRKKKGGIPHAIIKAQVWPSGYTPEPEIASPRPFREPTWMRQL